MFGLGALLLILLIVAGGFVGLVQQAGEVPFLEQLTHPYIQSVIRFTIWQAGLSTLLSIIFAIPLARALHRRPKFPGRALLIRLTSISLIVPTMVAILGIVGIHGRSGWVNDFLQLLGVDRVNYLYGLNGILIAHVFFNMPLVTRLMLNGLSAVPAGQWRLADHLGLKGIHLFCHVEWPALRNLIPGAAGIVFLLCFTSFAIVLALGGGPSATTLEVAIYQAVRFDFDLGKAVALSLLQIILCIALGLLFFKPSRTMLLGSEHAPGNFRPDCDNLTTRFTDCIWLSLATLFLLSPFVAVLSKVLMGNGWEILSNPVFWQSLRFSLFIAITAGIISTLIGLVIASLIASWRMKPSFAAAAGISELIGMLTLIMPPITLGTGLFLLLRQYSDITNLGLSLVIATNALFTLAFTLRILIAPLHQTKFKFDRLSRGLGIHGIYLWRWVLWPEMRRPISYALAVATTLSVGDMGVVALFGTDKLSTLPLLIYRLLGNYRIEQAAVVAVTLCLLCLLLFVFVERLIGGSERNYHA